MKKLVYLFVFLVTLTSTLSAQTLTVPCIPDSSDIAESHFPVYGYYMDVNQRSQSIYPDSLLTDMVGKYITELTYYFETLPSGSWGGTQLVRIGTTTATDLQNGLLDSPSALVWTGTLSSNISNNQMHITLDDPFLYMGGNLLIEFENPVAANWKEATFKGMSQPQQMSYITYLSSGLNYASSSLPILTFNYVSDGCFRPINTHAELNGTSALLSWSPSPYSASQHYILEYKAATDTIFTNVTLTDTFFTVNNIAHNSTFQWRVCSVCNDGDTSNWKSGVSVFLPPFIAQAPYVCDFEDAEESSQWTFLNGNGPNKWWVGTATQHSGTHSMYVSSNQGVSYGYTSGVTYIWAYRDIDFDSIYAGHRLSFVAKNHSYYNNMNHGFMKVYLGPPATPGTNTSNAPTGAVKLGGDIFNQSNWKTYSFLLDSTYQGVYRLYFCWMNNNTHISNPPGAIDDISVESYNCMMPEQLTTTNIDTTSAVVTWHTPLIGAASYYTLAYRTLADSDFTTVTLTDTSFTLTGLDIYTQYEWKVRSHCSSTDQSDWSEPQQFKTEPPIAEFPYFCDFEDSLENHYWRMVNMEVNGWYIGSATAQSGNQSLYVSNDGGITNAISGADYSYTIWAYRDIQLPLGYANYQISFDYKGLMDAFGNPKVMIGSPINSPSLGTYEPTGSILLTYFDSDTIWKHYTFLVDSTFAGVQRIYFGCSRAMWPRNPAPAIDNLTIVGNTCPRVHDLQNISVQDTFALLAWEAVGADSYTVAYKSTGDTAYTEVQTNDTVLRIGGLNSTTSYVWRVLSHCSDSTESYWSDILSFTTKLPIAILPYFCDFEDSVENAIWQLSPNSGDNKTYIGDAVAYNEGHSLYISKDNGVTNSYTPNSNDPEALRNICFTPEYPKYLISFDCKGGGDETGVMQIFLDDTLLSNHLSNAGFWTRQSIIVDSSFSGYHQLRLRFEYNTTWNPAGAFDNISIKGIFHEPPTDLTTTNITNHTAQLSWASDSSEAPLSYRLAWRSQSDSTYTEVLLSASDTTYTLANLGTSSWYVWKVQALYSDNEWSDWSGEMAFKTLDQLPYFCDFENELENQHWTIRIGDYSNGSSGYYSNHTNKWYIGTPSEIADNNKMLYISSDNGVTNSYEYGPPAYVWAYRDIYFDPGYPEYQLSLDFKGMGEEGYDYVRLFLDTPLFPPLQSDLPVPLVQIGEDLNLISQWTHKSFTIDSTHAGAQRLYILWTNNLWTGANPPAAIDNISINVVTCGVPSNLTSNPQDTSATLAWSPNITGNTSSYILNYKIVSDSLYTELNTQDTFLTIHGLTPTTDYIWRVRTICSSTDTSEWSSDRFFTTSQLLNHLPYQCDFSDSVDNSLWSIKNGNADNRWVIGNATGYGDNNALYISNDSGTTNAYTITSTSSVWAYRDVYFDESYSAYQLSFDFNGNGQSNTDYMKVFVGAPSVPSGTATPEGAVQLGAPLFNVIDWAHYSFTLDSTYIGVQRIYFLWVNNNSMGVQPPAAVDNLSVCGLSCITPSDLTIMNRTATEATLSWSSSSSSLPTSYTVSVRPAGDTTTTEFSTTDTFYVVSGLTPAAIYYCKVRANCSASDHSGWSSDVCVRMPATLPYICDFENVQEHNAWQTVNGNYTNKWYIGSAVNNGGDYSLYISNNGGTSNTYSSYNIYYPQNCSYVWAYRDIYLDPYDSAYRLSFDIRVAGGLAFAYSSYTNVYIGSPTLPNGSSAPEGATALETNLCGMSEWTTKTYTLDHTHAGLQRLYFYWNNGGHTIANPPTAIDNISIVGTPCANVPTALTAQVMDTLANLSWTLANGSADSYTVAYKLPNDSAYTYLTVPDEHVTVGNLTPLTTYVWKVRTNCTATDHSFWSAESSFQTSENTARLPYICDFEDTVENNRWTFVNGTYTNIWYIGNATNNGGSNSLYVSNDNGATNAYSVNSTSHVWAYRDFYFTPGHSEYHITFDVRSFGEVYYNFPYDRLNIYLGPPVTPPAFQSNSYSNLAPQGSTQLGSDYVNDSIWNTVTFTVDSTHAGIQRLFFLWKNDYVEGTNPPGAVDNIQISTSSCPIPMQLATVNILDDAATLTWHSDADTFIVAFKSLTDSAFTEVLTTETSYQMTNLEPSSFYTWKVKSLCSDGETSFWSNQETYQTHSILGRIPYAHGFEDAEENSHWTSLTYTNSTWPTGWFIGHAAYQSGDSALYISNDNGVSNACFTTNIYRCWAFRDFYFDPSYSGYEISFDYRVQGNADFAWMKVFIGPPVTPVDYAGPGGSISYAVPTGAVQIGNDFYGQPSWSHFTFTADTTFQGVKRLYFLWTNTEYNVSNPPAAVDNVSIQGCLCGVPTHITVDSVTAHTITIHFTPSSPLDSVWQAALVPTGSAINPSQLITLTDTIFTFQNLANDYSYDLYIRALCNNGEYSYWTQPITQRTDCGYISSLPYEDNFDTYGTATFPRCWQRLSSTSSNYPYIDLYTSGQYDHTYSTPGMMVFPSGYNSFAILPEIDPATPINELQISFQYKTYDPAAMLIVGVMDDPEDATTFTPVDTMQLEYHQVEHWAEKKVHLHNYTGNGHYIALRGYGYLDNVLLEHSTCPLPHDISVTNITDQSADIDWISESEVTSWQVAVKLHEAPMSQAMITTVTSKPYHINNLEFGKWYDVYVKANCDNGETSGWSVPIAFTTTCATITHLPYVEDFENYFQPWYYNEFARPRCWTFPYTSWAYPDIFFPENANIQETHYYVGDSHSLWLRTDNAGDMLMAVMPRLDVELHDVRATFQMLAESGNSGRLEVGVLNSTADETSFELVRTIEAGEITGSWTDEVVDFDLTNISGTGNHIAFRYYPQNYNWFMWMDNLVISYIHPSDTDSVGIAPHQLDMSIKVLPNPTTGKCTIRSEESLIDQVEVFDVFGKELDIVQVDDYQTDIDLSSRASGIYFVRVITEQGMITKRVVKR